MRPIIKRGLYWVGNALAITSIIFVALRLRNYSAEIDISRLNEGIGWSVVALSLIYSSANIMLALAWWKLLAQFGAKTDLRWAVRTYGISQLAKYVPGNIFHLAGRQSLGMAVGISGWALAKSSIAELALISAAGILFSLLVVPLIISLSILQSTLAFFLIAIIGTIALQRYAGPSMMGAFSYYIGFLLVSGFLFVALIELISPHFSHSDFSWIPISGAYVVAWLAGLVTPGAPAGVGIRELVLLFLLKGMIAEADLLLAVVLGRVITVVGDVVFYLISFSIRDKDAKTSN